VLPYLTRAHPVGDMQLKDFPGIFYNPIERTFLLSFIGSAYRPEDVNATRYLSRLRGTNIDRWADVQDAFYERGADAFHMPQLRALLEPDGTLPKPLRPKLLFQSSTTNFRRAHPGQPPTAVQFVRRPAGGNKDTTSPLRHNQSLALLSSAMYLSSIFCLHPPGYVKT